MTVEQNSVFFFDPARVRMIVREEPLRYSIKQSEQSRRGVAALMVGLAIWLISHIVFRINEACLQNLPVEVYA
jgi:hypothetical protein